VLVGACTRAHRQRDWAGAGAKLAKESVSRGRRTAAATAVAHDQICADMGSRVQHWMGEAWGWPTWQPSGAGGDQAV